MITLFDYLAMFSYPPEEIINWCLSSVQYASSWPIDYKTLCNYKFISADGKEARIYRYDLSYGLPPSDANYVYMLDEKTIVTKHGSQTLPPIPLMELRFDPVYGCGETSLQPLQQLLKIYAKEYLGSGTWTVCLQQCRDEKVLDWLDLLSIYVDTIEVRDDTHPYNPALLAEIRAAAKTRMRRQSCHRCQEYRKILTEIAH